MPAEPDPTLRPRTWWLDAAALAALCAALYLPGLWSVGLSTWQEAQRAMVAREMHRAGEWVLPLINGQPYLAKPPLFYWCQLGLASALGDPPDERALRLTAAIWATLGVLATYVVGRALVRRGLVGGVMRDPAGRVNPERVARSAGLLAAACLATGPAYLHHARVGELDIMLPALVTLAIGGVAVAWLDADRGSRAGRAGWIAVSVIATVLASLGKGPPALGVIAAGTLGAMGLWAAWTRSGPRGRLDLAAGLLGAAGVVPLVITEIVGPKQAVGAALGMACGALVLVMLARLLTSGPALVAWGRGVLRSDVVVAMAGGLVAFWVWFQAAVARVGLDTAARWSEGEAESNFRLLDAEVPYITLESALWSVGIGSGLCVAALAWAVWRRPRIRPAGYILLGWLVLGLLLFACFGKGFPRYLLPIWPCVAIIGGAMGAQVIARAAGAGVRTLLVGVVAAVVLAEVAWFGIVHPRVNADKSPRELIAELLSPRHGVKPGELAVFQFWTAAIDYYAGERPMIVGDVLENPQNIGSTPMSEAEFAEGLRAGGGSCVVLVREGDRPDRVARGRAVPGQVRLRNLGLSVEPIATAATYRFDGGRSRIVAVRVRWAGTP